MLNFSSRWVRLKWTNKILSPLNNIFGISRDVFLISGADEKEQYKAYGKTFRKMIIECLQKDPSKRPTAIELLKHPFFKKAKDRKYLTQTLVAIGPSMEARVHKVM